VPPLPRYLIAALRLFPPRPIGLVIVKKGESEAACKSPPGAITEFTISKSVAGREGGGRREEGTGGRERTAATQQVGPAENGIGKVGEGGPLARRPGDRREGLTE